MLEEGDGEDGADETCSRANDAAEEEERRDAAEEGKLLLRGRRLGDAFPACVNDDETAASAS